MAEHQPNHKAWEGEMFRLLAENVKDYAIFIIDDEGRIESWTSGAQRLLGYEEDEILGRSAEVFFTPEDVQRGALRQEMESARSTGRGEDDRWHVKQDGSRFWAGGVMTPLKDESGRLRGFAKIMRDRTEWKQIERARQESEASKAAVLETALDGILTIDHEDRIVEFNPAAEKLFGYARADVLGRKMAELIVPPQLREAHYRGLARYLATGEGPVLGKRLRLPAMRADGGEFPAELAIIRVPTEGSPLFTGYIRDVTERETQERRQAVQLAVTQILAEAVTIRDASPLILQTICENLGWDCGGFWLVDQQARVLRCLDVVRYSAASLDEFERAGRGEAFLPGVGLPGSVWSTGEPLWLADLSLDDNFPRLATAARGGLRGAFAVPLLLGDRVLGVMEFFSASVRERDADLLGMMAAVGAHVGQFIERKKSEERLRTLIDNLPHGAIYQAVQNSDDQKSRFTYVSAGVEQLLGILPEDALADASAMYDSIYAEDRDRLRAAEDAALRAFSPFDCEFRHIDSSGELRWIHCRSAPRRLPMGEVVWEGVMLDVTHRRRAEDALRKAHDELELRVVERTAELARANEFLRALLESIHDGIVACDADGKLTLFNRAALEFHGLPMEPLPAEEWPAHYDLYRADGTTPMTMTEVPLFRALGGERLRNVEMVIAPRQSPPRTLLASGQTFFDDQGNKLGAVVSMHDVTSRKRAEAALRRAHEDLERRVAERTAELARVNQELQDADRRKDEFLAMLAHELRNPLAPIRSGLDLLSMMGVDGEIVITMQQQVEHLIRLVDDLLDVSRIMRGKVELRKEPVELASLVSRAVDTVRPMIETRRQHLTISLFPETVWLNADAVRLAQVISNLLNNSSKYTEPGGDISLSAERRRQDVLIRVRDSGVGIEPDLLPQVFDLFTQAQQTMDRSEGGLGIGLTVVKSLVEMHGGSVTARSEGLLKGSEFVVSLPILSPPMQPAQPEREPPSASACRVLIVDDNVSAAKILRLLLLKLGDHQVFTAYDGAAALEAAAKHQPDIILLDIGLPKMDGLEVARKLRRQPAFRHTYLVALTGYGSEEDRRKSFDAGFDEHLVKPPGVDALRKLLGAHCSPPDV